MLMLILLFLCFALGTVSAQNINRDSLIRDSINRDSTVDIAHTISMGKRDGNRFRLNKIQLQKFKHDMKNAGSDLFKPTLHTVSDTMLLKDSVYVNAFRMAAYNRAMKYGKQTVAGRVFLGVFGVTFVIAVIALGIKTNSLTL